MISDSDRKKLEEAFPPYEPDDTERSSWVAWKEGKSNYKPFSLQMDECSKNGNLFKENCLSCMRVSLMCKKHGGSCMSAKCRPYRERGKDSA